MRVKGGTGGGGGDWTGGRFDEVNHMVQRRCPHTPTSAEPIVPPSPGLFDADL